jgi:hypothetical protein
VLSISTQKLVSTAPLRASPTVLHALPFTGLSLPLLVLLGCAELAAGLGLRLLLRD